MEELGLGDVDDISELSDSAPQSKPAVQPTGTAAVAASDSEWDSTVKSDPPKPGILKKWSKVTCFRMHTHALTHTCMHTHTHTHTRTHRIIL